MGISIWFDIETLDARKEGSLMGLCYRRLNTMRGSRGVDRGSGPPEKSQNYSFFSNSGPDSLKNHKATKPAFNVGPSLARKRNVINDVSLAGR